MELVEEGKTPEQVDAIEAAMKADGVATHESQQVDYFGFEEILEITLPDGQSKVQHQVLNEGARRKYQNSMNREVKVQRASGDAVLKMAPGDEKVALLKEAIVGWNLIRNGGPVPFNRKNLDDFLDRSNPRVIDLIEKEVRKANPWLQADMSLEDIDREIESLQELRDKKVEEEQGK